MPIFLDLLQPLANTWLAFLKNAPAPVVVMAFFITWILLWLPIATMTGILLNWRLGQTLHPQQKIPLLISLYLLAPLILWGINWLGLGTFSDYGWAVNLEIVNSLLLGFSLGVLGLAVVFSCEIYLGWCQWQQSNLKLVPSTLLATLLIALLVGGIEELIFRGFLFTELAQDYPVWLAAIISSVVFALLHLVWEQQETAPQLPGLWLMGIVLVLARFADRGNLGIAWGLHAGWVWAIATLDTAQLITYTGKVSEWYTGKYNKPLAGVAGMICLLGTGGMLWLWWKYLSSNI